MDLSPDPGFAEFLWGALLIYAAVGVLYLVSRGARPW